MDERVKEAVLKRIYENFDVRHKIEPELFRQTWYKLNEAVDKGVGKEVKLGDPDYRFLHELKTNNAVFAAFKAHREQNDLAALLTDENGKQRSFNDFRKASEVIIGKYNVTWLQTEHAKAIRSARFAVRFRGYLDTIDLFPNGKWLPSRAAEPRESHMLYYYNIRSLLDSWWKTHYPGAEWGCKCDMENTDEPITHIGDRPVSPEEISTKTDKQVVSPGLDRNPAFTGSIFTDNHPYIKEGYPEAGEAVKQFIEKELTKEEVKQSRTTVRQWAKEKLIGKSMQMAELDKPVSFTSTGIKEALNQPHKFLLEKNEAIRHIESLLKKAKYVRTDPDVKGRNFKYHYFETEIAGKSSFIVIRENTDNKLTDFYSIVEKLKSD